jgi:hypothetical protein
VTLDANTPLEIYLESVAFPLLLVKQVFANEDGSTGIQYLVSSDTPLSADQITPIYRKRWNVEPYHKSLNQNASLENRRPKPYHPSPTICVLPCALTSSLKGCVKQPRSTVFRSKPNSILLLYNLPLLIYVIFSRFIWLHKVSS